MHGSLAAQSRFCILPFTQLAWETDGSLLLCCRTLALTDLGSLAGRPIPELWSSPGYGRVRDAILANEAVPDCGDCYDLERQGVESLRQRSNRRFAHLIPLAEAGTPRIRSIELRLSNVCNLSCRTCGPRFSTAWIPFSEGKERGKTLAYGDRPGFWDELEELLPGLESIYFAGGEPLLHADHYRVLESLVARGLLSAELSYNTNLTALSWAGKQVIELWKKFGKVRLSVSLDGTGERGEYIRHGLAWDRWVSNLRRVRAEAPHVIIEIGLTLSVLNIFHFPRFMEELLDLGLIDRVERVNVQLLRMPAFYGIGILSPADRVQVRKQYEEAMSRVAAERDPAVAGAIRAKLRDALALLESRPFLPAKATFSLAVRKADRAMGRDIREHLPELQPLFLEGLAEAALRTGSK